MFFKSKKNGKTKSNFNIESELRKFHSVNAIHGEYLLKELFNYQLLN